MRTVPNGQLSQKYSWPVMWLIHLALHLASPSADKKLNSLAIAHWDAR